MESARINPKNPQGDYSLRPTYDLLDQIRLQPNGGIDDSVCFEVLPLLAKPSRCDSTFLSYFSFKPIKVLFTVNKQKRHHYI